ncbi:uncharacterized protein LOC127602690 isoform X2 [Hippocampus zosterae]|uniref:uncharacterized protein LOC127602690 isoform X2 n=1 Tax=Hippocampus zosterae TaxID=109293 RepID=UPI00223CA0B0|nr:uncharacterized protein LOC127602690 isoform X2 [Hippocampus zosterae]
MLKDLVRERMIAAADEIFALFERTIASYEEQLCRARDETERHRRRLEAVCKTQIVVRLEDVQQLIGCKEAELGGSSSEQRISPPAFVKEEGADLLSGHVEEEEREVPVDAKEERVLVNVSNLPPTRTRAGREADEDEPPERSHLPDHNPTGEQCEGPPPDHLEVPKSDEQREDFGQQAGHGGEHDPRSPHDEEEREIPVPPRPQDKNGPLGVSKSPRKSVFTGSEDGAEPPRRRRCRRCVDRPEGSPAEKLPAPPPGSANRDVANKRMTASKRRRTVLTVGERVKLIRLSQAGFKVSEIQETIRVGKTQIYETLRNKDSILARYDSGRLPAQRKLLVVRRTKYSGINERVLDWFNSCRRAQSLPLSGPQIREKASSIARSLGIEDFEASHGWLQKFLERNQLRNDVLVGGGGELKSETNSYVCDSGMKAPLDVGKSATPAPLCCCALME